MAQRIAGIQHPRNVAVQPEERRGMVSHLFTAAAGHISTWAGRPLAFVIALVVIIVWGITGPLFGYSDTWQLVVNTATTIVTFLMVFLIQNSQNRDGAAMQAKLDELLRAIEAARTDLIGIEYRTDQEIEEARTTLASVEEEKHQRVAAE